MLLLTTFLLQYIDLFRTTNTFKPTYNITSERIFYKLQDKNENNLQNIINELKHIDKLLHS